MVSSDRWLPWAAMIVEVPARQSATIRPVQLPMAMIRHHVYEHDGFVRSGAGSGTILIYMVGYSDCGEGIMPDEQKFDDEVDVVLISVYMWIFAVI
jgi:hypothetical protein